jgi:Zn-dependent protease with chaperone function
MNFFEHQEQARRKSRWLIILFIIAVFSIVFAVNWLVTLTLFINGASVSGQPSFWSDFWALAPVVMPINGLIIMGISWFKTQQLSSHGCKVAEMLGGVRVDPSTKDPKLRQLLNVVEEMSIAAGVSVPNVYLLDKEKHMNAFAAGNDIGDAVIGVTQGLLDHLNRDELQGVIAHEYSHIFHGDMKTNLRLLGVNSGILFLSTMGEILLRSQRHTSRRSSSGKNNGGGAIAILGLGLIIIGWIGVVFARLIQSSVSRQREFLADASAVQYTRNPQGIGQALSKLEIHGSQVEHPKAQEASHMFFGLFKARNSLFSTHPPIKQRLERLKFVPVPEGPKRVTPEQTSPKNPATPMGRIGEVNPENIMTAITLIQSLAPDIRAGVRDNKYTKDIVYALLAHRQGNESWLGRLDPSLVEAVKKMNDQQILLLIDLAMPVLSSLPSSESSIFYLQMEDLVLADKKLSPLELSLLALVRRGLQIDSELEESQSKSLSQLWVESLTILKILVLADSAPHTESEFQADPGPQLQSKTKSAFQAGVSELFKNLQREGLDKVAQEIWDAKPLQPRFVFQSLQKLAGLRPKDQARLFSALWTSAHHDHQITVNEAVLLKAFSEVLQVPLPSGAIQLTTGTNI